MQKKDKKGSAAISNFHIEADRVPSGISVSIGGVIAITALTDGEVRLKLVRGGVKVTGEGLSVSVYERRIVEVFGKVRCVEFR